MTSTTRAHANPLPFFFRWWLPPSLPRSERSSRRCLCAGIAWSRAMILEIFLLLPLGRSLRRWFRRSSTAGAAFGGCTRISFLMFRSLRSCSCLCGRRFSLSCDRSCYGFRVLRLFLVLAHLLLLLL